ncbi:MAG: NAD(P)/FAD-dependent oxidoreductase, partial [Candidatus Omnitrophota bacterium]
MYDIAVIGAGPAGSYAAYQAAKAGLKVIVIEEHPSVGEPSFCAGIVGQEMFERLGLPTGSIQNRLQTAVIHSPGGRQARLTSSRVRINIIDRIAFDREISHMAMDLGASFLISARCTDISLPGDGVKLKLSLRGKNTVEIKAKACILAAGVSYSLHKKIGLPVPEKFLDCAQTEVGVKKPVSCIEIYLGRNVAPCSFAWAVPVGPRRIRVGVSANRQAPAYLKKLLGSKRLKDNIKDRHPAIRRRIIPIDAISKTYAER